MQYIDAKNFFYDHFSCFECSFKDCSFDDANIYALSQSNTKCLNFDEIKSNLFDSYMPKLKSVDSIFFDDDAKAIYFIEFKDGKPKNWMDDIIGKFLDSYLIFNYFANFVKKVNDENYKKIGILVLDEFRSSDVLRAYKSALLCGDPNKYDAYKKIADAFINNHSYGPNKYLDKFMIWSSLTFDKHFENK